MFRGGFNFNNDLAVCEVEQKEDGTLVSCHNPMTGQELHAGAGGWELLTGDLKLIKSGSGSVTVSFIPYNELCEELVPDYATANTSGIDIANIAIIDGTVIVRQQTVASPVVTGDGVDSFVNVTDSGKYFTVIKVNDPTKDITVVF